MFLFPAEVSVPADADIPVVNQRRRLKRGRVAADVDDDGKDEPRKKPVREVRPEPTLKKGALSDSEESSKSSSVSPSKQTKGSSEKASSGKGNSAFDFKQGRTKVSSIFVLTGYQCTDAITMAEGAYA